MVAKNRNKSKLYLTNAFFFFISLRHGYFRVACNAVNAKLAAYSKAPFSFALFICHQAFAAYLMQTILKLNIHYRKACFYLNYTFYNTTYQILLLLLH